MTGVQTCALPIFYVAKEKDGTALRRLVIAEEDKARVFEECHSAPFLDTPAGPLEMNTASVGAGYRIFLKSLPF